MGVLDVLQLLCNLREMHILFGLPVGENEPTERIRTIRTLLLTHRRLVTTLIWNMTDHPIRCSAPKPDYRRSSPRYYMYHILRRLLITYEDKCRYFRHQGAKETLKKHGPHILLRFLQVIITVWPRNWRYTNNTHRNIRFRWLPKAHNLRIYKSVVLKQSSS